MDEETGLPEVPEDPNAGKTPEEIAADVNCMAHGICGGYSSCAEHGFAFGASLAQATTQSETVARAWSDVSFK